MKVITLWQPWASLVVLGHKKIETRPRNTSIRGPVLIHAAKKQITPDGIKLWNKYIEELEANDGYILPHGDIVGKVEIVETFKFKEPLPCAYSPSMYGPHWDLTDKELAFGDFTPGRYGWLLDKPVAFKNPIPANGSQGWWNYEFEGNSPAIAQCNNCGNISRFDKFFCDKTIDEDGLKDFDIYCPGCEEKNMVDVIIENAL